MQTLQKLDSAMVSLVYVQSVTSRTLPKFCLFPKAFSFDARVFYPDLLLFGESIQ